MKQRILPFFLPMQGCPRRCVYCDQRAISGESAAPTPKQVMAALAKFPPDPDAELAYYGGSFTCLPERIQQAYLAVAERAIREGRIRGVRLSTRPDAVSKESCLSLKQAGVVTVELGVQSFFDRTLEAAGRGCTAEEAEAGCRAVKEAGLTLGVQLMTGLPEDTAENALSSMARALFLGADLLRIYPTLVLEHTPLAALYQAGKYRPQTLDEAVSCCVSMLELAIAAKVPVIRMGVNPGPDLEAALLAGPYHPAFGGLVKEALRRRMLEQLLQDYDPRDAAVLRFARNELPLVFGQKRETMRYLGDRYPALALLPDGKLPLGELRLFTGNEERALTEADYCRHEARKKGIFSLRP